MTTQAKQPAQPAHRSVLIRLLSLRPIGPLRAAEIGVAIGRTSEALLRAFPKLTLYMVDTWTPYYPGGRRTAADYRRMQAEAVKRVAFAGDRAVILNQDSCEAARQIPDESLHIAFIDAAHFYESVKKDLAAWWPKVMPGGFLTGHDYHSPKNSTGAWGVKRAVDEFASSNRLNLEHDQTVWIIRK